MIVKLDKRVCGDFGNALGREPSDGGAGGAAAGRARRLTVHRLRAAAACLNGPVRVSRRGSASGTAEELR